MWNSVQQPLEKMPLLSRFVKIIIFLIFLSTIYLVVSFKPLTKDEQMESFDVMRDNVEPFRRNLTECARQVKASEEDVQSFLQRNPQRTMPGKCFVACMLKRNTIITKNKVNREHLLEANRAVYGEDSEVWSRLTKAISECSDVVDNIFEICEYASSFNDCMHMKMEHIMDKATMERRMEALGQMNENPDHWDEDELMELVRDEL